MLKKSLLSFFLFFALCSLLFAQMFGQEPVERERFYDVQHIKIEVKLDLVNAAVEGRVTTSIVPLRTISSFTADAVGMDIKEVSTVPDFKGTAPGSRVKFDYDSRNLTIYPGRELTQSDTLIYTVKYSTRSPEKGMYFIRPDSLIPGKPYQVWTQGEGEDNRYWFPCYDYPNDQATTEVIITTDSKFITLSNGQLINSKDNGDGTATWHWSLDKAHVSYLVMLAAGNFDIIEDKWDDIPIYSYVPPGKKDLAVKSFEETANMMKFFSEATGFKYPWGRFSQIVVEDFIYGGMENTGAVVLYGGSVYGDSVPPDYTATGLVAHELAHMWWGDAVTCRNWNEIWLNESFATYFEALYREHSLGKDEFDYKIMKNGDGAILQDSTVARKPIYTRDGLGVNTYSKGSVVLNMLRYLIGTDKFWKAMNLYITRNQFRSVSTGDLINAVNSALDDPMLDRLPPNMKWFFDEWIYSAGQPEYEVSYSYDKKKKEIVITARQVQRMDSSTVFKTPVPVEIITSESKQAISMRVSDTPETYKVKLDSKPVNVIFNKGNKVLCKVYFSKPAYDWLYQLKMSPDAIDRLTAIKGLKDFLGEDAVIEALNYAARTDKFWGVRYEAAQMLSGSKTQKAAGYFLKNISEESDSRIKRVYIENTPKFLKENNFAAQMKPAFETFLLSLINTSGRDYVIADAISALSGIVEKNRVYDIVTPFLKRDSHGDIIRRNVLDALDSSKDRRSLEIFMDYAARGSSSRLRSKAVNGLGSYLDDARVIGLLNEKLFDSSRNVQYSVISLMEKALSPSSKQYLEMLLEKTNDEGFKERIREVLMKIN